MSEIFQIIGKPKKGGVLIVGDHASNRIPPHIDLGLSPHLYDTHIAIDIGVAAVADYMVKTDVAYGFVANYSRLLVDLNRAEDDPAVIPISSDGIEIPGNYIDEQSRVSRLKEFYHSYHIALADLIEKMQPVLLLSLHSFTPQLTSKPMEKRPWEIGILYNNDRRAADIAIADLGQAGLNIGDQLPYSGLMLNASMNRHGEGNNIAYLGVEMRQDLVSDPAGQQHYAKVLAQTCNNITEKLGLAP
jgi:predicted N-formylglutamate amidohydrolase